MRLIEPYVLVKPDPEPKVIASVLLIDTSDLKIPKTGTIHMIGDKKENYKVKEGERVSYNKMAGLLVEIDDVEYLHMREMDIMAILS